MHKCGICGKQFNKRKSLNAHVRTSFGKTKQGECVYGPHPPLLVYMSDYDGKTDFSKESIINFYINENMSSLMIAEKLGVYKGDILKLLHYYGINVRSNAEATKIQIIRDGLWNKGQTKDSHPSVKKYAESRTGKNNPYFTAPGFEERHNKNIERFKKIISNRISIGTRQPKTTEIRVKKILDTNKIQYVRNFCIKYQKTWRLFDFLINGTILLELQGDYFHANPKFYKSSDVLFENTKKITAQEIWDYDAEKEKTGINAGYHYIKIWEDDLKKMSDEECLNLILSTDNASND